MDMDREEQLHQEDLQRLRGLRLIDDDFMNACFDGNIEGTELLLRIILDKPDISVKKVKTQKVMKNLLGRDIWLDIDADDSEGKEYDIEVQRADKVRYFKEDEKGVAAMCKVMEDMRNETAKNATIQATVNHIRDIMETFGVIIEKAMETLKIPVAQRDMYAGLVAKKTQ